jgi:uncharacterized protein (TIRG00374 family)
MLRRGRDDASLVRRRLIRLSGTLLVTGLCTAYIVWKIDVRATLDVLAHARIGFFLAGLAIVVAANVPLAWRWQRLLRACGIRDDLGWLLRAYFVSHAAGQVLPTAVGGDGMRIFETTRRHPEHRGVVAGSVLFERILSGCATLVLAGVGFALAIGSYDVGAYLWLELTVALATAALGVALFSARARRPLGRLAPVARLLRVERPLRAAYEGVHGFRDRRGAVLEAFVVTLAVQAFRVLSIWLMAEAAGVHLGPRPFYVMGPLLLLVGLIPFTINGFAVRESFFVSFLGGLGVGADHAFATGFLYFLLSIGLALPGAAIVAWESVRALARPLREA